MIAMAIRNIGIMLILAGVVILVDTEFNKKSSKRRVTRNTARKLGWLHIIMGTIIIVIYIYYK